MELQKVFTHSYMEKLRRNIHISDYQQESFPYDATQVKKLANIYQPQGLLDQMDATDDYKSAVALYKAYSNLTPLVASLPDLWVYLAHVDLFSYVQKRWSKITTKEIDEQYILNHWHENQYFLRTTFAGFWWHVYLTYDIKRADPYELTKVLFKSQDFRTLRFGELGLIRHREAMIGVLTFLLDNPEIIQTSFDPRGQYISRYFNLLGGSKMLSVLTRDFFYNKLKELKPSLLRINSIKDVQNKSINL